MNTYELSKHDFFLIESALLQITVDQHKIFTVAERSDAARLRELFKLAHDGELHIATP